MNQNLLVVVEHVQGQVAEITYIAIAAARALAQGLGGQVTALLMAHDGQSLANDLAVDHVLYVDSPTLAEYDPDAYLATLDAIVGQEAPRAVLLGDTTVGAELAGRLSARRNWPLISRCLQIRSDGGGYVAQICGGKILVEGALPEPTAILALIPGGLKAAEGRSTTAPALTRTAAPDIPESRTRLRRFLAPEAGDVDISKESVLVAVGRGIQQEANLELAEELAGLLGGVVCASRPIVDQGWLPTSRLVGKSGKRVSPRLYLSLGISGAPEHVEGMMDSETVIAINIDPAAPIFGVAKWGTTVDMFDLLPVLIERLKAVAG